LQKNNKDYKPQIDGLRALAVLPVIFFHAGFNLFKGGFVGVDVFFVISGYLITTIILKEILKGRFSLTDFYIRRSRRILPILYLITFLTIPFSVFLMGGEDLKFFSKEVISVIIFLSNFFFWKNTGYFSPNSELQPLLHTWSLGVEEQFYIFFPLFVIFSYKFFKKKIVILISIFLLISFILSQIGGNFKIQNLSSNSPYLLLPFKYFWQAGSANFYLPFGRIWEILAGSLVAIFLFKNKIQEKSVNSYLSLFGFMLIIFSVIFFDKNLQYPSIFTLLPVAGTLLIIVFATRLTILNKFLSVKPLVLTGLISYSLYLWHQPIFAFNRIYFDANLSIFHSLLLIIISLMLSVISWKFIEVPFRNKNFINNKKIVLYLLLSSTIILFLSFLIYFEKIKSKQPFLPQSIINSFKAENKKGCFDIDYAHLENNKKWYCEIGDLAQNKLSFAIMGDSHALALKPAFYSSALDNNKKGIFVGFSGCPALLDVYSIRAERNVRNCKKLNEKLFNYIKKSEIKKIFLISKWSYYTVGNYDKTNFNHISKNKKFFSNEDNSKLAFVYGLENTIKKYNDLGVEVVFLNQVPVQVFEPISAYSNSINKKSRKINMDKLTSLSVGYNKHLSLQKFIRQELSLLRGKNYNFNIINFDSFFCNNKKCKFGNNKFSYYADKNHLSIFGASAIKNKIEIFLK
jgi:peptidoglycan/LPS O-acetylase OafA/YrhL